MTTAARDIVLVGQVHLDHIGGLLTEVVQAWSARWLPAGGCASIATSVTARLPGGQDAKADWQPAGQMSGIWLDQGKDGKAGLVRALLSARGGDQQDKSPSSPTAWMRDVADEALGDLFKALSQRLGAGPDAGHAGDAGDAADAGAPPLADQFSPYVGALIAELAGLSMRVLLSRQAYAAALPRPTVPRPPTRPAAPLMQGLQSRSIPLRLKLGEIDVSLQDLMSLRPGDVLRLGPRLPVPLTVELNQMASPLQAHVGTQGHHLALQFAAKPSTTPPPARHPA